MGEEREEIEGYNSSNDGYTTAGVIQLRLDTGPMLDQIEAFLRGKKLGGYTERGNEIIPKFISMGKAKMNDEGVQSLMSWFTPLFSPNTVQGNFPTTDELGNFLGRVEMDLNDHVMINRPDWGLEKTEINGLQDQLMNTAEPFFTRLVGNKERDSYGATMVHKESSRVAGKNPLNPFAN